MERSKRQVHNRLLSTLSARDRALIDPHVETLVLSKGDVLFEPGEDVANVYFPGAGTIASFVLGLRDGTVTEAAMIGQEGAVGGIISHGQKPAFARAVVQIGGGVIRVPAAALEGARQRSVTLRDHFARYADCLLAQVLQSVACNAVHEYDARLARWLLATQDRVGNSRLDVTQQFVSEMLGVQRSYTSKVIHQLEGAGAIEHGRGFIVVKDRKRLTRHACECYGYLRRHYEHLLPGVYPTDERS